VLKLAMSSNWVRSDIIDLRAIGFGRLAAIGPVLKQFARDRCDFSLLCCVTNTGVELLLRSVLEGTGK
jgi:hypothetical protein